MAVYHITTNAEWSKAQITSEYMPENFHADGFVHCSKKEQLLPVANRFYQGIPDLIILEIDPGQCRAKLVEENLEGGSELFPHIYGTIPVKAVTRILQLNLVNGQFSIPKLNL